MHARYHSFLEFPEFQSAQWCMRGPFEIAEIMEPF